MEWKGVGSLKIGGPAYEASLWKEIRKEVGLWKEMKKEAAALREHGEFVVGDGRRICFWEDIWCGLEPLAVAFPTLYTMAASKGAFVAEIWDHSDEVGGGIPDSEALLMTGNWNKFTTLFFQFKEKGLVQRNRISWPGKLPRMGSLWLSAIMEF